MKLPSPRTMMRPQLVIARSVCDRESLLMANLRSSSSQEAGGLVDHSQQPAYNMILISSG